MKKYRLKKEAVPFFKDDCATKILPLDLWEDHQVDKKALEEVEEAYVTFGHKDKKNKSSSLGGWGLSEGAHFHFSIIFPSLKHREYDTFSKGKSIRALMDKIQNELNRYYEEFNTKADE